MRFDMPESPEEFLHQSKKHLESINRSIPIVLAILFVAFFFLSSFYSVGPDEVGVIRRFGKYMRTEPPGLHWRIPFNIERLNIVKVQRILKLLEGRPNVIDLLKNKEIQLVINTPAGQTPRADEVKIRTTAVYTGTPIMTTLSGAKAAALGIASLKRSGYEVRTLQEYH